MTSNQITLPPGVRLGVSPLSWANDVLEDLGENITLEECLTDASAVGYKGIELGRKFPRQSEILRTQLDSHGLALVSGWHSGQLAERGVDAEMTAVAPHADLLRAMGCNVLVYGEVAKMTPGAPLDAPMTERLIMRKEDVAGYASRITEFANRLFSKYGLTLAYHHHLMMVAETFDEISRLFDRVGEHAGLLLDTGHAVAAGFDYERLIDRLGDRIVHIHLKDVRASIMREVQDRNLSFNAGVRQGMFTVPGDGDVDFQPLARFVRAGGYKGWLVVEAEQDPTVAPPKPAVARAFNFLRSIL